jgi:transposase
VTDLQELEWNSWNGCSQDTIQNSWFSTTVKVHKKKETNYAMTYSQPLLSLWLTTMEGGPQQIANDAENPPPTKKRKVKKKKKSDKPSTGKVIKIRVYPSADQKKKLKQWFGTARWIYNQCLSLVQTDLSKRWKKELRKAIVNSDCFATQNQWALQTPYEVRDAAMVDLLNVYNSNFAKRSKNPQHQFTMHFRSKKAPQETIMIRGRSYKKGSFYTKSFGKEALRSSEPLPDTVDYDCKLVHTHLGHYYLVIPKALEITSDNQARISDRVVALDPGVRTFHTAYDPCGFVIGKDF